MNRKIINVKLKKLTFNKLQQMLFLIHIYIYIILFNTHKTQKL